MLSALHEDEPPTLLTLGAKMKRTNALITRLPFRFHVPASPVSACYMHLLEVTLRNEKGKPRETVGRKGRGKSTPKGRQNP